jgi:hypothetical protein
MIKNRCLTFWTTLVQLYIFFYFIYFDYAVLSVIVFMLKLKLIKSVIILHKGNDCFLCVETKLDRKKWYAPNIPTYPIT